MNPEELKQRTKIFAIKIIKLAQDLEQNYGNTGRKIGDQILRSGTSVYSNYRAACRCKSAKDFIHKMGTVVEEADETLGWLELLIAAEIIKNLLVDELLKEADELTAIMTASRATAIKNQKDKDN
jgi:four helix bundle protein